jgi:hypothetical protein
LAAANCVAADSEIESQTASLPIQKSAAKKCISKTASLPIQKSAARNYVAADSEIGSQKLHCWRFRNWQRWWSHFGFTSSFFWVFTLTLHGC